MLLKLFLIFFGIYAAIFCYLTIKSTPREDRIKYIVMTLFNSFCYLYYILYVSIEYEYVAVAVLVMLYACELRFILKYDWHVLIINTLALGIHFAVLRMIVIGALALYFDKSIYELADDQTFRIYVAIVFYFILFPYGIIMGTIFTKTRYQDVVESGQFLTFSVYFLLSTFLYALYSIYSLYSASFPDVRIVYVVIKIGVCSLFSFFLCLTFDYIFTILSSHKKRFNSLAEALEQGKKDLRKLIEEASIDTLTNLKVRDVAYTRVEQFLGDCEPFFVIYYDLDNLKQVNDTYGHLEGDFYIVGVAEILNAVFKEETVARIGGDEILVIGKTYNPVAVEQKIEMSNKKIEKLSVEHNKVYNTSVSYGLLMIENCHDFEDAEQIIKITDERMYIHKKSMNKERVVVAPNCYVRASSNIEE